MHGRIIEVSTTPIAPDEYANDSYLDCDHWFFNSIAGYVCVDENRTETVKWFLDHIASLGSDVSVGEDSFRLLDGFHDAYYKPRYDKFEVFLTKL